MCRILRSHLELCQNKMTVGSYFQRTFSEKRRHCVVTQLQHFLLLLDSNKQFSETVVLIHVSGYVSSVPMLSSASFAVARILACRLFPLRIYNAAPPSYLLFIGLLLQSPLPTYFWFLWSDFAFSLGQLLKLQYYVIVI